ncbi:MAG TPA: Ig domain-containing protein [Terriglobales bacterium]|nr:Ig domain-containing protein [Terriglobales bacterium]
MRRSPVHLPACLLLLLMGAAAWVRAQEAPPDRDPLVLATDSLPRGVAQLPYELQLRARGGTPPLHWRVASGALPPGIELDAEHGRLHGTPGTVGQFRFSLSVTDSGTPADGRERVFFLEVVPPLLLVWRQKPAVDADRIAGSVEITNYTPDEFDLTYIVVAVNEMGKAFALGYQHGPMKGASGPLEFPFGAGMNLPRGRYVVHVDAVAEVAARKAIYRARLQAGEFQVP